METQKKMSVKLWIFSYSSILTFVFGCSKEPSHWDYTADCFGTALPRAGLVVKIVSCTFAVSYTRDRETLLEYDNGLREETRLFLSVLEWKS